MLGKTGPARWRINISGGASTCEHQSASNVSNRNAGGGGGLKTGKTRLVLKEDTDGSAADGTGPKA